MKYLTVALAAVSVFLGIALVAQTGNENAGQAVAQDQGARAGQAAEGAESANSSSGSAATPVAYVRADPADPMAIGDPDAPIVLSEWTDMGCPFCAVFTRDTLPQIVKEYVDAGKVRLEINDVAFFGEDSANAAVAARAAGNQGKYFEYMAALYAAAPESGHPEQPRERLMGFAEEAKIPDLARFEQDLDDPELRAAVDQSTAQAQQIGVNSVPFFVVDGQAMSGAQPVEAFRQFLDTAAAQAQ